MENIIKKYFNFNSVNIKKLNGYDNCNYLVNTEQGKYIFKTYVYTSKTKDIIEAEIKALLFLHKKEQKLIPVPVQFSDGSYVKEVTIDGQLSICRMLSFLEGTFIGDSTPNPQLFKSFGSFIAQLDKKLFLFQNYVIEARKSRWDAQYLYLNKRLIKEIKDPRNRSIVKYFFQQFEDNVNPLLPQLRKSIIHGDANEWNTLQENNKISGLIDFGDLAYTATINELAILIAYACFGVDSPLDHALIIVKAYHEVLALEENELKVLYYLVAARLITSLCNSAYEERVNPTNEYASISAAPAWKLLYKWLRISTDFAENEFRRVTGFSSDKPASVENVLNRRMNSLSSTLSVSYDVPLYLKKSAFQYLFDAYGNTILDAYNNIPHVGHAHPQVVEAGRRQMSKLNTNTRYLYDKLSEYSEKLLSKFPKKLTKVFFVNSGSTASDLAIRMSKIYSGHDQVMVMEHGYHGNTQTGIDISHYKFNHIKAQGPKRNIIKAKIPDTFRGEFKQTDDNPGKLYARDAIQSIENNGLPIAAYIAEPIVGCGGQIPLADGYLKEIYPAIRKQGGVCISDEVQTGFGRLGDCYWGFEGHGVVPDIVILGKPMGNGHPIGAVVCTEAIAESFSKGPEFFSSFGGNPVSCAIGLAVLDVIDEEALQENAKSVGDYYKSKLIELKSKYPCIGDVRGSGLFLGIDIVEANSLTPDSNLAHCIKNELRNKFILVSTDGPFNNVIKTKPPMCFSKDNVDEVVEGISQILGNYA